MQFSTGCEYAIHGLLFLATRDQNEVVLVNDIARAQNLPVSYLAKVFQLLAKAGLLKSFRGSHGGYMLAIPPDQITLRHVTIAIEGSTPLFKPLSSKRDCEFAPDCLIREAFSRAEASLYRELEKVTLQEMVEKARHSGDRLKWLHLSEAETS
ncbi:MAG: Rrf2 family transcriptional regulator [bacterium]|nr:Rrf2 family transcriptional regulator [bacterium]